MFYNYNIVINLLEKKIFKKFMSLKKRILQKQFLLQLDNQVVFAIINTTKKLAYNLKDLINKILKTLIFLLEYNNLIESKNTQ